MTMHDPKTKKIKKNKKMKINSVYYWTLKYRPKGNKVSRKKHFNNKGRK